MNNNIVATALIVFITIISALPLHCGEKLLSTDIFALYKKVINISCEEALNKKVGFGLEIATLSSSECTPGTAGVGVFYHFYPSKNALKGFFIGPNFSFVAISATGVFSSIGGNLGYRWIWRNGFSFGIHASASFILSGIIHGIIIPPGAAITIGLSAKVGFAGE